MEHEILIYNKTREKLSQKFIKSVVLKALGFLKLKQPVELAVLVVSSTEIQRLNKVWRNKNYTPEELSFGLKSRKINALVKPNNDVLNLGEVVLNAEKISEKNNLSKLLIHSLLHLLDYSHKKMEQVEVQLFEYLKHAAR